MSKLVQVHLTRQQYLLNNNILHSLEYSSKQITCHELLELLNYLKVQHLGIFE